MKKVGIAAVLTSDSVDVADLAVKCEQLGFDSLWLGEHPVLPVHTSTKWAWSEDGSFPRAYPLFVEPLTALMRAATVTKNILLGTGVCLVAEHNPLVLAKEIATLDMYSGGRFLFGIGAGWHKEEAEMLGVDFPHRWTQVRESVEALKVLWTDDESEYHGQYYDFPPVWCYPKPSRKPHPPIIMGGHATNAFKRIISWGDGWMPNRYNPEELSEGRKILDGLAREAGRDPSDIEITAFGQGSDPKLISAFHKNGADRVVIMLQQDNDLEAPKTDEAFEKLESIAANIF